MNTTNDKNKSTPRIITVRSKPDGSVEMIELGNPDHALKYAAAFVRRGQLTDGIKLLKVLATLRPNDSEVVQELGYSLMEANQPKEALPYAQKLMQACPEKAASAALLGMCQKLLGRTSEASKALELALAADFTGIESLRAVVALAMMLEQHIPEVEKLVRKIQELEPDDHFGWVALGNIYRLQGKLSEAEQTLNRAVSICPSCGHGQLALRLLMELRLKPASDLARN